MVINGLLVIIGRPMLFKMHARLNDKWDMEKKTKKIGGKNCNFSLVFRENSRFHFSFVYHHNTTKTPYFQLHMPNLRPNQESFNYHRATRMTISNEPPKPKQGWEIQT
jgi:hypothetical protein